MFDLYFVFAIAVCASQFLICFCKIMCTNQTTIIIWFILYISLWDHIKLAENKKVRYKPNLLCTFEAIKKGHSFEKWQSIEIKRSAKKSHETINKNRSRALYLDWAKKQGNRIQLYRITKALLTQQGNSKHKNKT